MLSRFLIFVLVLLATGCSLPKPGGGPLVSGKLTVDRQPVAGVRVRAYPLASLSLAGPAPFRSAPSAADGSFSLALPAGEYYLLAEGESWFSYYGRNPVAVPPEGLEAVNLGLVSRTGAPPTIQPFVETGVLARLEHAGRPLSGVTLFVYTDLTSQLKGMGYVMAGPSDAEGLIEAALPPGTYYLLARQRRQPGTVGPLQAGDFIGYYPGNPVRVAPGEVLSVSLPLLEVPAKVDQLQDRLFGQTSIHGRIVDAAGRPVAGARAVLYDDPQMFNRPLFVSQPTGPDGRFVLSFPHGGRYYLAARNSLGGAPGPGELYGTYDASPDHALSLETGESLEGIEIRVEEMW